MGQSVLLFGISFGTEKMILAIAKITLSLLLLAGVLLTVSKAGKHYHWPGELQRKTIHSLLGIYALSFPFLFESFWEVGALCGLAFLLLAAYRYLPTLKTSGQGLYQIARPSHGEMFFILSVGLLFYLSSGDRILYILPLLILALSDAAAALIGIKYGQYKFQIDNQPKSVEGSVVFFLSAWLLALISLLLLTALPALNIILLSFMIALLGTAIEAVSWRGLDNLFVPMGLYLLLRTGMTATIPYLAIIAIIFGLVMIWGMLRPRRYRLNCHSVCAGLITLFFIAVTGSVINMILPFILLALYFLLRRPKADNSNQNYDDDLSFVLGVILTALGWFLLHYVTGMATNVSHNISFALNILFFLLWEARILPSFKYRWLTQFSAAFLISLAAVTLL